MWLLGTEPMTSGRAASALNHEAISAAPNGTLHYNFTITHRKEREKKEKMRGNRKQNRNMADTHQSTIKAKSSEYMNLKTRI